MLCPLLLAPYSVLILYCMMGYLPFIPFLPFLPFLLSLPSLPSLPSLHSLPSLASLPSSLFYHPSDFSIHSSEYSLLSLPSLPSSLPPFQVSQFSWMLYSFFLPCLCFAYIQCILYLHHNHGDLICKHKDWNQ